MSMYAGVYQQDCENYTALLCANVVGSFATMREIDFHIELVGPPIDESQDTIKDFGTVRVLGPCDGSCKQLHRSAIRKMMRLDDSLVREIVAQPNYSAVQFQMAE